MFNELLEQLQKPFVKVRLSRWAYRTDLPGTDYRVKRRYSFHVAFYDLFWTVYAKGGKHRIYYKEDRCSVDMVMGLIERIENGQLLKEIKEQCGNVH